MNQTLENLTRLLKLGGNKVFVVYLRQTRAGQHSMCLYVIDAERVAHSLDQHVTRLFDLDVHTERVHRGLVYPNTPGREPVLQLVTWLGEITSLSLTFQTL